MLSVSWFLLKEAGKSRAALARIREANEKDYSFTNFYLVSLSMFGALNFMQTLM